MLVWSAILSVLSQVPCVKKSSFPSALTPVFGPRTDVNLQGERAARDLRGSEKFERPRQGWQLNRQLNRQLKANLKERNLNGRRGEDNL